jgi:DNA-binding transcriptional regulator PaaX
MRGAGFLKMRREGKHNFYRLQPSKFEELGEVVYSVLPAQARAWPSTKVTLANSGSMAAGASAPGTLASSGG